MYAIRSYYGGVGRTHKATCWVLGRIVILVGTDKISVAKPLGVCIACIICGNAAYLSYNFV